MLHSEREHRSTKHYKVRSFKTHGLQHKMRLKRAQFCANVAAAVVEQGRSIVVAI